MDCSFRYFCVGFWFRFLIFFMLVFFERIFGFGYLRVESILELLVAVEKRAKEEDVLGFLNFVIVEVRVEIKYFMFRVLWR